MNTPPDELQAEITRLRATIAEMREESEWQPISTAPVNESVLVYIRNAEHYGEGIYRAMQVDMGTGRRWMTTGLGIGRDVRRDGPTHWLPLPPPPDAARQPSSGREGTLWIARRACDDPLSE